MPASRSARPWCLLIVSTLVVFQLFTATISFATTQKQQSDPSAIVWATNAMNALTGGVPITSATLTGTVVQGDNEDQGNVPITLQATSVSASEIDITTPKGVRSLIRSVDDKGHPAGTWIGVDQQQHSVALHNCWTDAAWFFPALSQLSEYTDPNFVFLDLGQEQHQGTTVEHIRVYRSIQADPNKAALVAKLSTVNYYLDINTAVPLAVSFADHPNDDLLTNLPIRIEFSNFQLIGRRLVPFQIIRYAHGTSQFQITISNADLK